ncbi:MAG: roadblock/LC7 domain-containing protein [Thermoleophilia bacterium]
MASLKDVLLALTKVEGINTAVIASRDGFVIDGVTGADSLDTDAVGAVISTGIGSSEVMGRELGVGDMSQSMIEYGKGIVMISFLGADAILAVVADLQANLGNIRYQVKKHLPYIEQAL